MSAICIVDTSVFLEVLDVPVKSSRHDETIEELRRKITLQEKLFLPLATIVETGNHIGQNGDGRARRACAQRYVDQVTLALTGASPFTPISFVQHEHVTRWMERFPEHASTGSGIGDLSIILDWEHLRSLNPYRSVYIWSFDQHLAAYAS